MKFEEIENPRNRFLIEVEEYYADDSHGLSEYELEDTPENRQRIENLLTVNSMLESNTINEIVSFYKNQFKGIKMQIDEEQSIDINYLQTNVDDIGDIIITYYDRTGKAFKVFKD